ncbi:YcaO-like family protein [Nonomuraea sp. MG754425]|uniref:YcaO-like family protein n=1 Tax=Nonomuraea sp. MG754425 TaxID=2570319 RepID=UPI001F33D4F4|nr:YcaO-like family protein [Nonomuraea sp. MG754425]
MTAAPAARRGGRAPWAVPAARPSPVDPRTGLITHVLDLPVGAGEPEIFNSSVRLADTAALGTASCYDNNGGAGLTRAAARGAAIGEGLERYCAAFTRPERLTVTTWRALSDGDHPPPRPADFALFHPGQPERTPRFDDDTPVAWTPAYSLTRAAWTHVPACLVHLPYTRQGGEVAEHVAGPAISTGLACATSRAEAVLSGLHEAIERDAFMISWLRELPLDRVDLLSDPSVADVYTARLRRPGLDYHVLDMTRDLGVPAFLCLLLDHRQDPPIACAGGAAHHDPARAVLKALLEAAQTREWARHLCRTRRGAVPPAPGELRTFEDHVFHYASGCSRQALEPFLDRPEAPIPAGGPPPAGHRAAVESLVARLAAAGLEVLVTDLTTPDVAACGYHVVKVVVPGLQPLYADESQPMLGGHRVYAEHPDAPCPRPRGPEDLNREPHPYP